MKSPLDLLAGRLGIATRYQGATGEWVEVAPATVHAVAASMGIDTSTPSAIAAALAELDIDAAPGIEPVIVAWDGIVDTDLARRHTPRGAVRLTDETSGDLTDLWRHGQPLPFGYHHLDLGDGAASATVISAPVASRTVGTHRKLGLFAPLFALRPTENRHPDLRELDEMATWVADHGGDAIMTLPLLAGFFGHPSDHSPYSPASRVIWNELYAVVDRPEYQLVEPIDYPAMFDAAHAGIAEVARTLEGDPMQSSEFLQFLARRPDVLPYARFRAAGQTYGRDWRQWPEEMRHGTIDPAMVDAAQVRIHSVGQWVIDSQITELATRMSHQGVDLALDLAVGAHPLAFDVWRDQRLYVSGCVVRAPPDAYFPSGQSWGFPPPDPRQQRATAHQALRSTLRFHLRVASLLRIDHVMALMRLFWIPDGQSPEAGTYVASAFEEQLAVVCLEARLAGATIVGENLGLVPDEIDRAIHNHALLGMSIATRPIEQPRFATLPPPVEPASVASFGTHDMATFAGLIHNDDLADRLALGFGDPSETRATMSQRDEAVSIAASSRNIAPGDGSALYDALSAELAATSAEWVILALDDLWGERRPHNVPGTSTERPNWLRRCAFPLSSMPDAATNTFERAALARKTQTAGGTGEIAHDAPS